MSERYSVNPNNYKDGVSRAHAARYYLARGFVKPDDIVVDGACGTGYGSYLLAQVAKSVLAIDKDDCFENRWRNKKTNIIVADLENLTEMPNCDVWVCLETIEHLKDPDAFLNKITKTTRKKL